MATGTLNVISESKVEAVMPCMTYLWKSHAVTSVFLIHQTNLDSSREGTLLGCE